MRSVRSSKWIDRLCKTVFICSAYAVEAAVEMQGAPGQKSRGDDEHDRVHLKQRDAQERAGKVHQAEKAEKTEIPKRKVRSKLDKLLREFILSGGFEISTNE